MITRLFMATGVLAGATLLVALPAQAHEDDPCEIGDAWFVNPDEADRAPERTYDGFVFEPADLIHHVAPAGTPTATLSSGDYTASPAPDQPSFFSVEVVNDDGTGYATLRYNRSTHLWDMVVAGNLYSDANPDALVGKVTPPKSKKVVRFGVGYTKNPPGTKKVVVSNVSFQGKEYSFKCVKPTSSPTVSTSPSVSASPTQTTTPSSSSSPSTTATSTASPSSSATTGPSATSSQSPVPIPSVAGNDDPSLPVTGPSLGAIILGALTAVALGIGAIFLTRRRRLNGTR